MPILSEHPRSIDVIRKLSDECDSELEAFLNNYTDRRRAYMGPAAPAFGLAAEADPGEYSCVELLALLDARELAAEELRDELRLMDRELSLLKRELRRARRKLLDVAALDERSPAPDPGQGREAPTARTKRDTPRRAADREPSGWLKPWLKGFLPGAA